jgi:hypothetical protein
MRGEVLGVERRRRWSDEDKLSILSSIGIDGAIHQIDMFQAQRRHGPNPCACNHQECKYRLVASFQFCASGHCLKCMVGGLL